MPATSVQQIILDNLKEIKATLEAQRQTFQTFVEGYIRAYSDVQSDAALTRSQVKYHDETINRMALQIAEINRLIPFIKTLSYVLSSLCMLMIVSLGGFVWALITHRAAITIL